MRYKNNTQCDILTEIPSIAVKLLNHLFKIKFCFSLLLMTRTIGKTTLTSFNMLDFASINVSVINILIIVIWFEMYMLLTRHYA